jgi:hypothetical protein
LQSVVHRWFVKRPYDVIGLHMLFKRTLRNKRSLLAEKLSVAAYLKKGNSLKVVATCLVQDLDDGKYYISQHHSGLKQTSSSRACLVSRPRYHP